MDWVHVVEVLTMKALYLYLVLFPFAAAIYGLLVASLIWVYRDAEARNKSGLLVVLLVLLLNWPLSLLLWLVFRPDDGRGPGTAACLGKPA
jgi:hypothetical protein